MPYIEYEEDDRAPYYSEEYSDNDYSDEYDRDEEEYCEDDFLEHNDEFDMYKDDSIIPVEWKLLKMGDAKIRISNEGKIHFVNMGIFYITPGIRETGTPYRYVNIEVYKRDMRKYYVHDLVWRAFNNEDPPEGWEVRHVNHVPYNEESKCYDNHLQYLDIYPRDTCTHYRLGNII